MTPTSGATRETSRATSTPDSLGIRTSTSAIWGFLVVIFSSASRPSRAVATTSKPTSVRTSVTAVSSAGWSSATIAVIGFCADNRQRGYLQLAAVAASRGEHAAQQGPEPGRRHRSGLVPGRERPHRVLRRGPERPRELGGEPLASVRRVRQARDPVAPVARPEQRAQRRAVGRREQEEVDLVAVL